VATAREATRSGGTAGRTKQSTLLLLEDMLLLIALACNCGLFWPAFWACMQGTRLSRHALLLAGTATCESAAAHLDNHTATLQELQHKRGRHIVTCGGHQLHTAILQHQGGKGGAGARLWHPCNLRSVPGRTLLHHACCQCCPV
jgi:hypothetical protein